LILIFIKNAELGKVKTRLAATLGDAAALDIYKKLLMLTQKITLSVDCQRFVYYSNFIEENDIWQELDFYKRKQTGDDLGERMKNAFAEAFETHEKVVIIGSDCAELNAEIVNAAFAKLDSHDFVIGPAHDGGYYLLGMNSFQPTVFDNIIWSSEEVFSATIAAIHALNKSVALLPMLNDLDNEADWEKVKHLF
jgi:rSAM/selenodomain-associated transferase 1